ncbi:MAG: DUF6273 domain-containing protein [Oscillospiraceae bacterium]|jgi:hypothetical protein|nr:DUF6273 domain-containing protein [Oscillospiraceae bacterium]
MKKSIAAVAAVCVLLAAGGFLFRGQLKRATAALLFSSAATTPVAGEAAKTIRLQTGDFVFWGSYRGEPILWRVLALEGDRPLLFSEYILCFKAFSAAQPYTDASSDWAGSALRQWLNATQEQVPWTGVAPAANAVLGGWNPYADEPGFLSGQNFSARERALLHGGSDAVFLLSKKQLSALPAARRKRSPTQSAAARDTSPFLTLRRQCWYWTRSPVTTNQRSVTAVTNRGAFYKSLAADSLTGVCPAVFLATSRVACLGGDGGKRAPFIL